MYIWFYGYMYIHKYVKCLVLTIKELDILHKPINTYIHKTINTYIHKTINTYIHKYV